MKPVRRELKKEEKNLREFLLSAEFPGVAELRAQAAHAVVSGECECGCGTIDLELRSDCSPAQLENRIPVEAWDQSLEVLLFIQFGDRRSHGTACPPHSEA